jgi:hypothetical protein
LFKTELGSDGKLHLPEKFIGPKIDRKINVKLYSIKGKI